MVQRRLPSEVYFHPQAHHFGCEERCALPTVFDSIYCYALGHVAGQLVKDELRGFIASLRNLKPKISD